MSGSPPPPSTAYVVAPPGAKSGPGVLVLHGWWGLTPFFRRFADRLADEGFVALVPDLHGDQRTAESPDEAEALLATTDPNVTASTVLSSATALRSMPLTADGPIGVVGFSMGASWGMWLATRAPELVDATVMYYGTQDIDFARARSAFLGHFAEHDEFVTADARAEMEAHLRLLQKDVEFHEYPGTGHWFVEQDRPAAYVPGAAELAWERTVEFLRTHVTPPA
jgi:carboxymethylenebutenolidase